MDDDKKLSEFMLNNKSPNYLHPLDTPTVLTTKNKEACIAGTITKPEMQKGTNSPEANAWTL